MTAKAPKEDIAAATAAIKATAEAYLEGKKTALADRLHDKVHVLGSEQGEDWPDLPNAMLGLDGELNRIWAAKVAKKEIVTGALVAAAKNPKQVQVLDNVAWWSGTGALRLEQRNHAMSSWTVVLNREGEGGEWKIVHSHFSIHR